MCTQTQIKINQLKFTYIKIPIEKKEFERKQFRFRENHSKKNKFNREIEIYWSEFCLRFENVVYGFNLMRIWTFNELKRAIKIN